MSLKRKASFSCESFQGRRISFDMQTMKDVPSHLNSRTRKRFRDNRPDEQTVYGECCIHCEQRRHPNRQYETDVPHSANTLRMLYQAQKETLLFSTPPADSITSDDPSPLEPEPIDPRQQTLLQFFRPVPSARPSLPQANMNNNNNPQHPAEPVQPVTMEFECGQSTSASGSSTPASTGNMDMDVDMGSDANMNDSTQGRWAGSIGWM